MASHTIKQVLTCNYKNRTVPIGLTTPRIYKLLTTPSGRRFLVTYAVLSNPTTTLSITSAPFTMASGGVSPIITTPNEVSGTSTPTDQKVKICVFMGASPGTSPVYMEAARELARAMAEHDIYMVYGGGTVGLMGEVARTLVSLKGPKSVHGIIPEPLVKYERSSESEDASMNNGIEGVPKYASYGRTTVVKDMHTRKQKMVAEVLAGPPGSGFIALPGGFGTMEELMEIVTWNQLGIHKRGIVALNIAGFWDGILEWVQGSVEAGFITESNGSILKGANSPEEAVMALKNYQPSTGRFQLEWGNVSQG